MTSHLEKIRVGIVGMGRASSFIKPIMTHPHANLADSQPL
jgi:hypothetical protein